jgi:hypothetical protein
MAGLFPLDDLFAFRIYRMHTQGESLLWRKFRAAGYDITTEQLGVLASLREHEGMNQSQLGEKMYKDLLCQEIKGWLQ